MGKRTGSTGSETKHRVRGLDTTSQLSRPTWPQPKLLWFALTHANIMSFNDLMHPRNIYRNAPPDFKVLGEKFDYFRKHTKETKPGRFTLNFKNPEALRALTCALLEHDFKIKISIPLDRLIPTVPLRLNYVLWIEDLLSCLSEDHCHAIVRGFDIGKITNFSFSLLIKRD